MKRFASLLMAATVFSGSSLLAHAAPVGTLTCSAQGQALIVNVGHFQFGAVQAPITSTVTGAGQTYKLLNVHAALSQFGPLYQAANYKISTCELTATLADGSTADFVFSGVSLHSVTAVAHSARVTNDPAALFTDATFSFTNLVVKSAGGVNDGGTDGGWFYPAGAPGSGPTGPSAQ